MLWIWGKEDVEEYHNILVLRETLQQGQLHQRHGTSQHPVQGDFSWHHVPSTELQVLCSPVQRLVVVLHGELHELWVMLCCRADGCCSHRNMGP